MMVGTLPTTYLGVSLGTSNKDRAAPTVVTKKLEKIQMRFLWDAANGARKFHLVRWKPVTTPTK
ncbi:hypothetical protein RDI58_009453 [Solanum bulbocastanum]|uniref:Uncharacterized protein n=1 Tax=Solanum bulbocastanum TaxID=147425 RepID=A0AAN8U3X5_SOLBU